MGAVRLLRLLAVAIIPLLLTFGTVGHGSAQGFESSADFELHKLVCPADTMQIFDTCHEDRLGGVTFAVGDGLPATDENGVFTGTIEFNGTSTTVTIVEDPAVAANYVGAYLYCRDLNTNTVLIDGRLETNAADIVATDGQTIVCDWYDLTPAAAGPTGSPTAVATAAPVTGLPGTGGGPIHETDQRTLWILLVVLLAVVGLGIRELHTRRQS